MAKITYKGVTKECKFYKNLPWDKPLTPEMKKFEEETGKNAVWNGVVTGTFEFWMYWRKSEKTKKSKSPKSKVKPKKSVNYRKTPQKRVIITQPKVQKTVSEDTFIVKKRRGTKTKPIIDKYMLNGHEVKYNWTEGQLYVDDKKIGKPDTIYGRDFLLYAKKHSPKVSLDIIQSNLMYNRDYAIKKGWNDYAKTTKQFADNLGVNIE